MSATTITTSTAYPREQSRLFLPSQEALLTLKLQGASLNGTSENEPLVEGWTPASYPQFLPTWEKNESFPPWPEYNHDERGKYADKSFKNLLDKATKVQNLQVEIGTEIDGVQLSQLDKKGLDELALLAAERGILIFRNQNLKDQPPKEILDVVRHFGRLHIHPTTGHPQGSPEIHVISREPSEASRAAVFETRLNSSTFHTDVSYEKNVAGTTFLIALDVPPSGGGDTVFASSVVAYERLSPDFRKRLEGVHVYHDGSRLAIPAREAGSVVRYEPVSSIHPLIRTHPATGKKSLFVSPNFTSHIVGFKKEESDLLLNFLNLHVGLGIDFQARVRWEPGTVVVFDNRTVLHTPLLDFKLEERRHVIRVIAQAEVPQETL